MAEPSSESSSWAELTHECLTNILSRLTIEQRWRGPMLVCKLWHRAATDSSLLPLRSRTQVRVGPHRVSGLVVAGVRDQDRFHAPICRPLEPWISFHYSDQTLLRFISRPRRSRVIKLIFFPLEILILFGWEKNGALLLD